MDRRKNKSKKWRLRKALAVSLAVMTAFCALPASNVAEVKAAKPYVSLRTAFKTLQTGQSNCMTLKNNTLGWKITKVSTNDRTIAMVYGKTKSSFMVKGKSAGRTTVEAKLKTTARKKYNTKTVRCRINVIPQENGASQENVSEASVSDQAGLIKALQNKDLKKLEIHTNQSGKLVIPKGNYADVALTVYAPAADIENNGTFKSITLTAIQPDTWMENAIGNIMRVTANAARIIVGKGASLEKLNFAGVNAKASLEVNGNINEMSISAKMELTVSGTLEKPIPTVIEESAEGTVLETSAPLKVTTHASASLTFHEGAENSTVEIKSNDAKVDVKNNTKTTITIINADGTIEQKSPVRVSFSTGFYYPYSPYRPPVADLPSTPGAIVPTGGGINMDPAPEDPDGGININPTPEYPDSGGESLLPTSEEFLKVMNPTLTLVVTRSALTAGPTVISMSALLTLNIKPDAVELDDPDGYIEWCCPDITADTETGEGLDNWMKLTEPKQILIPLPEYNYEQLPKQPDNIALQFRMKFHEHSTGHESSFYIQIYAELPIWNLSMKLPFDKLSSVVVEIPFEPSEFRGTYLNYGDNLYEYVKEQTEE